MIKIEADKFVVIGGTGNHDLDKHIIEWINSTIGTNLEFMHIDFDYHGDNEDNFRIPDGETIKGKIAVIFQSVYELKLKEHLMCLCYAAKYQYGAEKIIAVLPFMNFRRQDHDDEDHKHEINRNRQFIHDLKSNGVDKLVLCDIHSRQTLENCKKEGIEAHNVSGATIFADRLMPIVDLLKMSGENCYVYSPDGGSVERAYNLAKLLDVPIIMMMKKRDNSGEVKEVRDEAKLKIICAHYKYDIRFADTELVDGSAVIVIDDEISTGRTGRLTGWSLKEKGAKSLVFCATHPVCSNGWKRNFIDNNPYDRIIFGNTIPRPYEKSTGGKITDVFMTKVIASQLTKVMFLAQKEKSENDIAEPEKEQQS